LAAVKALLLGRVRARAVAARIRLAQQGLAVLENGLEHRGTHRVRDLVRHEEPDAELGHEVEVRRRTEHLVLDHEVPHLRHELLVELVAAVPAGVEPQLEDLVAREEVGDLVRADAGGRAVLVEEVFGGRGLGLHRVVDQLERHHVRLVELELRRELALEDLAMRTRHALDDVEQARPLDRDARDERLEAEVREHALRRDELVGADAVECERLELLRNREILRVHC
jgi:hypothetical protein